MRYLHPANHHLALITKAGKDFAKRLDFKDKKIRVKIRDFQKIEKKISITVSVLGDETKEKYLTYLSKQFFEKKHVDLLFRGEGEKNTIF